MWNDLISTQAVVYGLLTLYLAGAVIYAVWLSFCHAVNGGVLGMLRASHGLWEGNAIYRDPQKRFTYQMAAFFSAVWMTVFWPYYAAAVAFGGK